MKRNSIDVIIEYSKKITNKISINDLLNGNENVNLFSASVYAENANIERSNCSRTLNSLVNDNILIKISGRPVIFLHKETFEKNNNIIIDDSLYSLREFIDEVTLKIESSNNKNTESDKGVFKQGNYYEESIAQRGGGELF